MKTSKKMAGVLNKEWKCPQEGLYKNFLGQYKSVRNPDWHPKTADKDKMITEYTQVLNQQQ